MQHAGWRGVHHLCAQHTAVQSEPAENADDRDVKFLAIHCLIQSCREATGIETEFSDMREKEGKGPSFTRGCGAGRIFISAQGRVKRIFISSVIDICLSCSLKALQEELSKLSEVFLLPFFITIL